MLHLLVLASNLVLTDPSSQLSCLCFYSIYYLFQSTLSSILSCLATALYNRSLLLPPVNCLVLACPHQLPSVSCPSSSFLLLSFPCMTAPLVTCLKLAALFLSYPDCRLLFLDVTSFFKAALFPVPAASGDYLSCLVFSLQLPN
jgi:hypothetical protein